MLDFAHLVIGFLNYCGFTITVWDVLGLVVIVLVLLDFILVVGCYTW